MKVAIFQMCSSLEPHENLAKIKLALKQCQAENIEALFLPEVFYSISDGLIPTPYVINGKDSHYEMIQDLSKESGIFILGGSAATKGATKLLNRSYNFSPEGEDLGFYDKMNLFSCDLSRDASKQIINENLHFENGHTPKLIDVKNFKLALSICFDLRFPEIYRYYSSLGAELISISSAFTVPTGRAHWHTLVRARAIENQCYVIAAGQWGKHNDRISTFGHSLIVDPWGEILADAGEGEKIISAEISKEKIKEVRSRLNVLKNPAYLK